MQVFRSKKDWWLVAFLVCMTGLLVQLLLVMSAKGTMQQYPLHTAVYILTIVMIWWPVLNTRYELTADQLIVKSMLDGFVFEIPQDDHAAFRFPYRPAWHLHA